MPKQPKRLNLKFRVRPLVRMPKSVMFGKLQEFVESGIAPADIEVAYMEYGHTRGRKFTPGERLREGDREELRKFYNVLLSIQPEEVETDARRGKYTSNPESVRIGKPDSL